MTHPENAIIMPKWKGDPTDKDLIAMIPFLECVWAIILPAAFTHLSDSYRHLQTP